MNSEARIWIQPGDIVRTTKPLPRMEKWQACTPPYEKGIDVESAPDSRINWKGKFAVEPHRVNGGVYIRPQENILTWILRELKGSPQIRPFYTSRDNLILVRSAKREKVS